MNAGPFRNSLEGRIKKLEEDFELVTNSVENSPSLMKSFKAADVEIIESGF